MREFPRWSKWMLIILTLAPIIIIVFALFYPIASDIECLLGFLGLVLNATGAAIIAFPDVPKLSQYALPNSLRHSWKTLQDERQLTPADEGFESLVEFINR